MPFGKTYAEIEEMILKTALYTPMCRDIVRRAGLRPAGAPRPVTVIDDYVSVDNSDTLRMQWTADLTAFTRVRFASSRSEPIYVMYSALDPVPVGSYDPGDYTVLTAVNESSVTVNVSAAAGDTPEWLTLLVEQRKPLRFALSTSPFEVSDTLGEEAFRVALEVF